MLRKSLTATAEAIKMVLAFCLVVLVVVTLHELGHLLVAVAFGVSVEAFSVGFGSALLSFEAFDIEWRLAAIPLGGYVAFHNEALDGSLLMADAPGFVQAMILLAGVVANGIYAVGLMAFLKNRYKGDESRFTMHMDFSGFLIVPFVRNALVSLRAGWPYFWWFTALVSMDLMLINALFIFPLDGGRLYFVSLETVGKLVGLEFTFIAGVLSGLLVTFFVQIPLMRTPVLAFIRYLRHP